MVMIINYGNCYKNAYNTNSCKSSNAIMLIVMKILMIKMVVKVVMIML